MTEDIITELSKIKDLQVFPRAADVAYRDKPVTGRSGRTETERCLRTHRKLAPGWQPAAHHGPARGDSDRPFHLGGTI